MTWVGRPKSPLPRERERESLATGHTHNTTQMWVPRRLWAMLVLLLVEPWSAGYHHPYHHSPKLRKIQRPQGTRLHFWTIQRLGNCFNTQRSTATSTVSHLNTLILLSTNPWYKKNKAAADVNSTETKQVSKPSAHLRSIRPLTHIHTHVLLAFTAMKNITLTSCFQLHDRKKHTLPLCSNKAFYFRTWLKCIGGKKCHKGRGRRMRRWESWGWEGVRKKRRVGEMGGLHLNEKQKLSCHGGEERGGLGRRT